MTLEKVYDQLDFIHALRTFSDALQAAFSFAACATQKISLVSSQTIILGAFAFRSWKSTDSLLTALEVLRELYASGEQEAGIGSVKLRLAFEDAPIVPDVLLVSLKDISPHLHFSMAAGMHMRVFPASFVRSSSIHRSLICDGCAIEKGYDQA